MAKYLSPPGRGGLLYFVPGTPAEWLADASLPIAMTEGEKKTIALWRLGWHALGEAAERPRWLPVGLSGVWNWRGREKAACPDGSRRDLRAPIADLARIEWTGRRTYIAFDSNAASNPQVQAARAALARELSGRGAEVLLVDLPELDGVNGVDDLLALRGPKFVLALFDAATPFVPPALNRTEMGNAERLIRRDGADLRYCPAIRKWLVWDGARFASDERGEVMLLAKSVVRAIYGEAAKCGDDRQRGELVAWARQSEKAAQLRAMLALEESEPGVPVIPSELDSDIWLLNAANGTIDLRSGKLRPHRRADLMTRVLPVAFDPHARALRWERFLMEVFEPHADIVPFIARAVGYSLTGSTREECLFLLYGHQRPERKGRVSEDYQRQAARNGAPILPRA